MHPSIRWLLLLVKINTKIFVILYASLKDFCKAFKSFLKHFTVPQRHEKGFMLYTWVSHCNEQVFRINFSREAVKMLHFIWNAFKMKFILAPFSIDISLTCTNCKKTQREPYCRSCKGIMVKCSVCRIGVRGRPLLIFLVQLSKL